MLELYFLPHTKIDVRAAGSHVGCRDHVDPCFLFCSSLQTGQCSNLNGRFSVQEELRSLTGLMCECLSGVKYSSHLVGKRSYRDYSQVTDIIYMVRN